MAGGLMANLLYGLWLDSQAWEPRPVFARARMRNRRAREAVEMLPPYIDSRSDNIAALAPNLAALRPFLKP